MLSEKGGVKPPSPAPRGLRSGAPHSKAGSARKWPNSRGGAFSPAAGVSTFRSEREKSLENSPRPLAGGGGTPTSRVG
jgi:hypothetical protein